jgi:imidazolonepropionase-like amidohydrolase
MKGLLLSLLFLTSAAGARGSQDAPLYITHVSIVDVIEGSTHPDQTVEIEGRTITSISNASTVSIPQNARVVDGRGKYLIPGLWDMHVHLGWPPGAAQIFLPMLVANGVLGARDMHSELPIIIGIKRSIASGTQIGPRLIVAGPALDGPNSYLPAARIVNTPDEARRAVRDLKAAGVDFIKVYSSLPKDLYFAIADEAKRERIPFVGHVPYALTATEASDAGQRSFEHLTEVDVGTSTDEAKIKAEEMEAVAQKRGSFPDAVRLRGTYDSAKASALFARFRRNDTWQVPTLIVMHAPGQHTGSAKAPDDSLFAYIPQILRNLWNSMPVDFNARIGALGDFHSDLVGQINRAGVPILAGTDFPNPWVYPGFSLHDELGLLVAAGLTPAGALRTATINPARFLGLTDSLGVVGTGKVADLVLLDGNPLESIANTKRIRAVIQGGRLLDRQALDDLLAEARKRSALTMQQQPAPTQ